MDGGSENKIYETAPARKFDKLNELHNVFGSEEVAFSNYDRQATGVPFLILEAGVTYPNPEYLISRSKRAQFLKNFYVLEYVQKGTGTLETEHKTYTLKAGDSYLIKKNTECVYYSSPDDPLKKMWINCAGQIMDSLTALNGFDRDENPVIITNTNTELKFRAIMNIVSKSNMLDAYEINRQTIHQIVDIMAAMYKAISYSDRSSDDLAERVKKMIDSTPFYKIRIEDISEYEHYSQRHINRMFTAKYGVTPKQYLTSRKIEAAKDMLSVSGKSVKEVAELLGFCDEHHFMNTFKRVTGYSVGVWRGEALKK